MPGYKSDHSDLVTLKLSNTSGRGFWKLNTSLLTESEFINQIKSNQQTKHEYASDEFVEFYKVFRNDLADVFINAFNYAQETRKLSVSQRRGIFKLIFY